MTTYRERRERKAERLREWAESRERKAAADLETARERASHIPFGQPILVGHHSENRDRRYRDGIARRMDRGIEHQRKAEDFTRRADGIESQLAGSIYDDDPDALERLRAKLDGLIAQRQRITDYNDSCRKALKADPESKHGDLSILDEKQKRDLATLARVASYQIRPGGAFPSYATSNLGGQISQLRARIERLEREQDGQAS